VVAVWATEKLNDRRRCVVPLPVRAAAPVLFFCLTLFITESPLWLLKKGRLNEARANLTLFHTDNPILVEAEISAALVALQPNEGVTLGIKAIEILKAPHLNRTLQLERLHSCLKSAGRFSP